MRKKEQGTRKKEKAAGTRSVFCLLPFSFCLCCWPAAAADPSAEGIEFFEKKIRPLLVERCHECHGPQKQRGGLRLDSRSAVLKGGDNGPALVPGEPGNSRI